MSTTRRKIASELKDLLDDYDRTKRDLSDAERTFAFMSDVSASIEMSHNYSLEAGQAQMYCIYDASDTTRGGPSVILSYRFARQLHEQLGKLFAAEAEWERRSAEHKKEHQR